MYLLLGFELNVMLFQDDCLDNSDEDDELCRNLINRHQCPDESMFDCNVTDLMTCIVRRWTCDGKFDCPNGNDESPELCNTITTSTTAVPTTTTAATLAVSTPPLPNYSGPMVPNRRPLLSFLQCTENHFKCQNTGYCIPKIWKCDGFNDCLDNSDELQCNFGAMKKAFCRRSTHEAYKKAMEDLHKEFEGRFSECLQED